MSLSNEAYLRYMDLNRFVVGTFAPELDDVYIRDDWQPDKPVFLTMNLEQAERMILQLQKAIEDSRLIWQEYEEYCKGQDGFEIIS